MEIDQQKKDNETTAKLNELMAKDKELMAKDKELTDKDNELMTKYNELMAKDKQMSDVLDEVKKMETGTVDCGDSHDWTGYHSPWKTNDVTVTFKQPYKNNPAVQVSFMYIDDSVSSFSKDLDDEFGVDVVSVNTTSFILRCQNYRNKHMQEMKAGWVSLPQV